MIQPAVEIALDAELIGCVEQTATLARGEVAEALVADLSNELGEDLVSVVFYGSRLNRTAGPRSDWDFFVVVERYSAGRRSWFDARLNAVLPPSIYRREVTLRDGSKASCKLSLVSGADLERYTSPSAPDSYLFGRLSKHVALVFSRDALARREMVEALARSVALCAAWTLAGATRALSATALAKESVAFSYRCEERVEGPSRAEKLFEADAAYFGDVYGRALAAQVAAGRVRVDSEGLVRRSGSAGERAAVAAFVRRSRRRARLRWLKNILTFEGWDEYMLTKLERHQDVRISLSDRERRHPLLAAARHYVRLRREGRLSGGGDRRSAGSGTG